MDRAEIAASPGLRVAFLAVAASMLFLWVWSLIPLIENWNNPHEDGFSAVPAFYGTLICLPIGLLLLVGGISPRGQRAVRARYALYLGGGTLFIVVAFLIFQQIANSMGGLGVG
jgi:hypothetical protein